MEWLQIHAPNAPWAPHGLPGPLKVLPGWVARGAAESRFAAEIAEWTKSIADGPSRLAEGLPDGNGHGVLVIPGFGFGDTATTPMQIALRAGGYRDYPSQILFNVRCADRTVGDLVEVAERAVELNGGPVHVVGHSRGGMLARGLAVRRPDLVSRVISLGAPLNYEFAFYEMPKPLVGVVQRAHQFDPERRGMRCSTAECTCDYMVAAHGPMPPGIDLVSVYTTSDGVVDWRACVVPGARNIEVPGTHLGMGLRPGTLRVVLQELAAATDSRSTTETNP